MDLRFQEWIRGPRGGSEAPELHLRLQESALQGQIWGPRDGSEAPGLNLRLQGGFEVIGISEPIADYMENSSI